MKVFCLLIAALGAIVAQAAPGQDLVMHLPGVQGEQYDVTLYSGFLDATPTDKVHYMFVESENDPSTDPVVLWLQGGPGASSLMGAFQEFGPFIVSGPTSLVRNEFAWSKAANLLFLESPTGVGFSYCEAMTRGDKCHHNDTTTANLNLQSLKSFVDLFPEYSGRDFMIWGESYAGVFVPTLADLIYESSKSSDGLDLNFIGFAVGDPCTSEKYQHLSDQLHFNLRFAYTNGFISSESYDNLMNHCTSRDSNGHLVPQYDTKECNVGWRYYYIATANNDGQNTNGYEANLPNGKFINTFNDYGPDGGPFDTMLRDYLSSEEVKAALHVSEAPVGRWGMGDALVYVKQHYACFFEEGTPPDAKPEYPWDMLEIYKKLAGKLPRILVFNGDTDPDVQYRGTEAAIDSLGLGLAPGGAWRPWFYVNNGTSSLLLENKQPYWGELLSSKALASPQLGGYVKNYAQNVTFLTVHTSGHMVPQFKPVAALQLFARALKGLPLSPPIDEDVLSQGSLDDFFGQNGQLGYMGKWVGLAQSSEYTDTSTGSVHRKSQKS